MIVLTLIVVVACLNLLGVKTASVSGRGDGYEMTVEYPRISRPGLAVRWSVTVRHPGGFDGPITIATNPDYLDILDENGREPEPSATTGDDRWAVWEFDPPDGDTFMTDLDARIEPAVSWGVDGRTELRVDGEPVISLAYRSDVWP